MKYNLSRTIILNYTGKPNIFSSGLDLYQDEKVYITEGIGTVSVNGVVMDDRSYDIKLRFSKLGDLLSSKCTCKKTLAPCAHIIATLLQLMDDGDILKRVDTFDLPWPFNDSTLYDQSKLKVKKKHDATDQALSELGEDNQSKASFKASHEDVDTIVKRLRRGINTEFEPISLQVFFEFTESAKGHDYPVKMSFKVGRDHLYVIKDIQSFMRAVNEAESMKFGTQFTYVPDKMRFDKSSQKIFEQLERFLEEQRFYGIPIVKNGVVQLTHQGFLSVMERIESPLFEKKSGREIAVEDRRGFLDYQVMRQDGYFECVLSGRHLILLLGTQAEYVYLHAEQPTLIVTTDEQQRILKSLYPEKIFQSKIVFGQNQLQRFMDYVLPSLEAIGTVLIEETLEQMFVSAPLEHEAYLDYYGGAIQIELYHKYGDVRINALTDVSDSVDKIVKNRDVENERQFMLRFENCPYHLIGEYVKLLRDHEIFDFLKSEIHELEQHCTLYRSDRFLTRKILASDQLHQSLKVNTNNGLLEYTLEVEGHEREEALKILRAYREKRKYYKLKNGDFIELDDEMLAASTELLMLFQGKADKTRDVIQLPRASGLYVEEIKNRGRLEHLQFEFHREIKTANIEIPRALASILRPYQAKGVSWLYELSAYQFGGILADDMGLGKTLQMLTFMLMCKTGKMLIVAPTSLIYNWANEIEKFTKELSYEIVEGAKESREKTLRESDADIFITSYGVLRNDQEIYEKHKFEIVVLDEAQHIKNEGSLTSKVVKQLNAEHRFALTGTPLENHLGELWSIFDFVMPGYLGSRYHFKEIFEKALLTDERETQMEKLRTLVEPFMLRRVKSEVLTELPEKLETDLVVGMTEAQQSLYRATLLQIKGELNAAKGTGTEKEQRMKILVGLTRLRQICAHPSSYIENYDGGSGKLDALMELMEELMESGHRTLVFSQYTSVLKIIQAALTPRMNCFYLDGSIAAKERMEMVNRFNNGEGTVFLISLKAGGSGLNLTGADTVIHFDPWWNPAVEDQATDRAHRIGQKKTVHVMKLITKNSIEEKILELKSRKKHLFDQIVQPGETFLSSFSFDEIKSLFEEREV